MNNAPAILKTLVIFAVIVPLAVFIGYLLANPMDASTFAYVGILTAILIFPLLLRWHHPVLIFSWNSGMFLFVLPGRPELWLGMTAVSLGITMLQRALGSARQLVSVPQVTWSLLCLIGVVVLTAKLTGMGLHSFGSEISGGKRYINLLGAILGYFALSSHRIPHERANLYIGLFFLPGLLAFLSDLWRVLPGPLQYIYLFFPARESTFSEDSLGPTMRLAGGMLMAISMFSYMQARYGIRGIFLSRKPWRWMILAVFFGYGMFGGFRSSVMIIVLVFVIQFFIEGLHRTKLLMTFAVAGVLGALALIPLAPHLPHTIQRALSFLPLQIDPIVRETAEESTNWRLEMWKALLPQVPEYLLLGRGYAVSRRDIDTLAGSDVAIHASFAQNQLFALSGNYHSGPLSVVMTFGIWGVIAVVWFWVAGIWVLSRNYRYGDPALRMVNAFLLAAFVARVISFILIFGVLDTDFQTFAGFLGLGVSLNGGVCHPAPAPVREANRFQALGGIRPHLQPALRRRQIRS